MIHTCTVYTAVYICSVYCMVRIFAVYAAICWQVSYSVNHTIYLYLVSININCTNNIDVTHYVLFLICVFCFVTMYRYVVFCIYFCVSLYFVLLFCKTYMKNKILSTHSQQGEGEDPMV